MSLNSEYKESNLPNKGVNHALDPTDCIIQILLTMQ